jgi:hypothetical protein
MALHIPEYVMQGSQDFLAVFEAAIVCALHPRVVPEGFDGVEFWRVSGQRFDLQPALLGLEPGLDRLFFVIRGVVVNVNYFLSPAIKMRRHFIIQETHIGVAIENLVVVVDEGRVVDLDTAENLRRRPRARHGHFWLLAHSRPGAVQR